MNAQLKPRRLIDVMREDRRFGAPSAHLEAPEVPQWVEELPNDMTSHLVDAIKHQADDKRLDELHVLLCACCRSITADELVNLRDSLRAMLLDYAIAQANRMLEAV